MIDFCKCFENIFNHRATQLSSFFTSTPCESGWGKSSPCGIFHSLISACISDSLDFKVAIPFKILKCNKVLHALFLPHEVHEDKS